MSHSSHEGPLISLSRNSLTAVPLNSNGQSEDFCVKSAQVVVLSTLSRTSSPHPPHTQNEITQKDRKTFQYILYTHPTQPPPPTPSQHPSSSSPPPPSPSSLPTPAPVPSPPSSAPPPTAPAQHRCLRFPAASRHSSAGPRRRRRGQTRCPERGARCRARLRQGRGGAKMWEAVLSCWTGWGFCEA
jgi:hypothetical protein